MSGATPTARDSTSQPGRLKKPLMAANPDVGAAGENYSREVVRRMWWACLMEFDDQNQ
jgi:hypothetical protein